MYNDHYLLKRIEEEQGAVSYASATDNFTSRGEVVATPIGDSELPVAYKGVYHFKYPQIGDKVLFYKGSGEDVEINGEPRKVVKFEDIIMKI